MNDHTDPAFEAELRALLHRTADPIEPDPAGWRQLNTRITRRRQARRAGGLALAGAAAAVVAVGVLSIGDDQRVELAPADLATQPSGPTEQVAPAPTTRPDATADVAVAGGILYSDGNAINIAELDGTILSTPVALGVSSQTITDVAVRPGGTTETATMAYRVDGRSEVSPEGCGDISWAHVPGPDDIGTSGMLPRTGAAAEDCLGAPVFLSDGSGLAWLADTADGEVALQTIDWAADGPVDGTLVTFGLDLGDLTDPALVAVTMPGAGAESGTAGTVLIRAGSDEPGLYSLPIERQGDGALALRQGEPEPLRPSAVPIDPVFEADDGWVLGRPTDELFQDGLDPAVLAYSYIHGTTPTGQPIEPDASVSAASTLTWRPGQRLYLDAIGDTAVMGSGGPMHLAINREGRNRIHTALPEATAAALLASPDGTAPEPGLLGPPDGPPETESPAVAPRPSPSSATAPAPTPTPTGTTPAPPETAPSEETPPQAVRDAATAIRQAAAARDWAQIDALIPDSGFTSNFGGETDHVAVYQQEEADGVDVLGILAGLLAEDPATEDGSIWVWPAEYLDEGYLAYRVGIRADGTWIFYVAGD